MYYIMLQLNIKTKTNNNSVHTYKLYAYFKFETKLLNFHENMYYFGRDTYMYSCLK